MSEAILAVRPGETVGIAFEPVEGRTGEHVYIGALIETPDFPGAHHAASRRYVIVVAQEYPVQTTGETAWGWVNVTPESKQEIGDLLLEMDAQPGRWYYLVVTSDPSRWETE